MKFDEELTKTVERLYETPDVVTQRQRTHELLALEPGERVLDVGSGPGLLAFEMAGAVGASGSVRGIDTSPTMVEMSQRRCSEQPWVALEVGDARALPYEDATFDAAVSTQVYEYVPDVPAALGELRRVLRAGGRAVVIDSDWHSIAIHSDHGERMTRVLSAWDEHLVHPGLPRILGAALGDAGFAVRHTETIPLLTGVYEEGTYPRSILGIMASFVSGRAGVSEAEAQAWHAEFAELGEQGRFFLCLNRYVFVAEAT